MEMKRLMRTMLMKIARPMSHDLMRLCIMLANTTRTRPRYDKKEGEGEGEGLNSRRVYLETSAAAAVLFCSRSLGTCFALFPSSLPLFPFLSVFLIKCCH